MPFLLAVILSIVVDVVMITGVVQAIRKQPSTDENLEFAHLKDRHPPLKTE